MCGFQLVPVDGGGGSVQLPLGETVLGRGPLLGTHVNPCFLHSSMDADVRPLQRDSWSVLSDGDIFSLLPNQFIYRVEAVGGDQGTPRNSQMFEEGERCVSPEPPQPDPPADLGQSPHHHQAVTSAAALSNQSGAVGHSGRQKQFDLSEQADDDQRAAAQSVQRKRVLPSWMLLAAGATVKSSAASTATVQRKKAAAQAVRQAPPTTGDSPEEEEEARPRKKRKKDAPSEQRQTFGNQNQPVRSEDADQSDVAVTMGNQSTQVTDIKTAEEPENKRTDKRAESNAVSASSSASSFLPSSLPSTTAVRTPCPYGKDCYRKNPLHFQECSHPGDPDYQEQQEEEEEEEEKPECPYGTNCYRKNPLHRKEFRHSRRPARSSRTATKKASLR
ncbi:aprataxin and PNK-like factor isoform 2-T2 [Pholidichthys leucotaenia]